MFPNLTCEALPADHGKWLITGEIGSPREHSDSLLPFGVDKVDWMVEQEKKKKKQFQINHSSYICER